MPPKVLDYDINRWENESILVHHTIERGSEYMDGPSRIVEGDLLLEGADDWETFNRDQLVAILGKEWVECAEGDRDYDMGIQHD